MTAKKPTVPKGYQTVTPYLRIKGAVAALDFYARAFGAKERYRLAMGDRIGHAEIDIGTATVMLADEFLEMGAVGPKALGGSPVVLTLFVPDTDAMFNQAVAAGATVKRPPQDEFYGYRSAHIAEPFGHSWMIQTKLEEVSPQEMQSRLDAMMAAGGKPAKKPAQNNAKGGPKRS